MKKILFLLLITASAYADTVSDLENAIIKTNLPEVEKLVARTISITSDEQTSLINLATEIIKKRENKIFINSSRTNIFFNNEQNPDCHKNDPIYWEKYLKNHKKLKDCDKKGVIFVLASAISSCIVIVTGPRAQPDGTFLVALTAMILTAGAALYCIARSTYLKKKVILKYASKLNARYNDAIKIRQLLYKIKPARIK